MDLRLHAADEPVDFRGATVDVAIRYGRGSFPGLKAEELFRDEFAPVASPHLGLREPGDLRRQTLIHFEWYRTDRETPIWPRWLARAGMRDLEPRAELTLTDESHAIQAAIAGQGVALLDLMLIADELASGALVQPFGSLFPSVPGIGDCVGENCRCAVMVTERIGLKDRSHSVGFASRGPSWPLEWLIVPPTALQARRPWPPLEQPVPSIFDQPHNEASETGGLFVVDNPQRV